jgi:hypothetical protein
MSLPRRLIHNEYDLQEVAELQDRPIELIERDFALVTIAAHLVDQFPGQLCFKGGFVLRHVRGYVRQLALTKFTLVKRGDRRARIEANMEEMRTIYEQTVPGLAPDAPPFADAQKLVLDALATLLP